MTDLIINKKELETAIKEILPFCSKEETRYYICGINFNRKEGSGSVYMAATDGNKLCQIEMPATIADSDKEGFDCTLDTNACKTILIMLKSVNNNEFPIQLVFNKTTLHVNCGDQKADFLLIDGKFPDYRRVIPTNTPAFQIGLAKSQAIEAVKAVKAHKSNSPVEWRFTDSRSPITLISKNKIVVVMSSSMQFSEELNIGK